MSTSDDIKENLIDTLAGGVQEKQIGDRRYKYFDPKAALEVMKELQADEANSGSPFIKVKMGE